MIDFKSSCRLKTAGAFAIRELLVLIRRENDILQLKWEKKNRFPSASAQATPNMPLTVRLNGFKKARKARCYGLLLF